MTKLRKVILFVNRKCQFTRKEFEKMFGEYPNTESTYLRYLESAQYLEKVKRGVYRRAIRPPPELSLRQLYSEAYLNWNKK